jgi:hypothetical protein
LGKQRLTVLVVIREELLVFTQGDLLLFWEVVFIFVLVEVFFPDIDPQVYWESFVTELPDDVQLIGLAFLFLWEVLLHVSENDDDDLAYQKNTFIMYFLMRIFELTVVCSVEMKKLIQISYVGSKAYLI